ncbi:pentatricopeptide repeat-containing protein At1g02150-like [Impatiens glandulifera]|uniref:pentatricopeptide repeat-containing protein At1g02150-like n=1 Tax=Impatiens glandulifera TaxID=253017 RepID=UPI001FB0F4E8|nr:pentatricopeptide repeat-containing protein At1g02150-like [Impatiens glandulifera]
MMLLQSTLSQSPLQNHRHVSLSSSTSSSTFRSFVYLQGVTNLKFPLISCKISEDGSQGAVVDYEKRSQMNWNRVYKRLSLSEDPNTGAATVLNQCEKEGKNLTKWALSRIVKELRRFRKYKLALEVYDWTNEREERFRTTTSDTAIQLDLISKVHGVSSAEDYFQKLPTSLKDKRTYGSLLNVYGKAKLKDKAESLLNEMRTKGFTVHSLHMNVMMTLYMSMREYDKVDTIISEMKSKSIPLDLYSYNIWLSSLGSRESIEGVERVFNEMQQDALTNGNWTTFSTMATTYIKLGQLEKACECLKEVESRISARDRIPYHYLISLYGTMGNKEEVQRVWSLYNSIFPTITNLGYLTMISSLTRLGDIEQAQKIYEEWLLVKTFYDPRISNILIGWYARNGFFEKAEELFSQMTETGGKPNAASWEVLAEGHVKEKRISSALSCLKEAVVLAEGSSNWKPKPTIISAFLELCEEEGDMVSKERLVEEVLRIANCLEDAGYMSHISLTKVVETGAGTIDDYELKVEVEAEAEDISTQLEGIIS